MWLFSRQRLLACLEWGSFRSGGVEGELFISVICAGVHILQLVKVALICSFWEFDLGVVGHGFRILRRGVWFIER